MYHLIPFVERPFIDDTYANRRGRGEQAVVHRAQTFILCPGNRYYLQDVQNFFNSIPYSALLRQCDTLMIRYITNELSMILAIKNNIADVVLRNAFSEEITLSQFIFN